MDDQKIENLLNLALDTPVGERSRSENLEAGYDAAEQTWEVIVRCSGGFPREVSASWETVLLSGGYAVVRLPQADVDRLSRMPEIDYIEKSKRLYFEADAGRAASCVSAVQTPRYDLSGRGVLVALIDSGVDYFHPDFRNDDGSTRILAMWDQTAGSEAGDTAGPPDGFTRGAEYTQAQIDAALAAGSREAGYALVPERDADGHGTQVLGVAAGNGRASGGGYRGMAPDSGLIVVKLGSAGENGFPQTTELVQAVEYAARKAQELDRPIAINISYGNVYGSHRGTSLIETYIDMMALQGRSVIVTGTGNEGSAGGHAAGTLMEKGTQEIEFLVGEFEVFLSLQIWKNYADEYEIRVTHPAGFDTGPLGRERGASRYRLGETELLAYYGEPAPYQEQQEIYLEFLPEGVWLDSGVWKISLTPIHIVTGRYNMWMSDGRTRNTGTRFLYPSADATMTIPSTASHVIAVGAYDARRNAYASFSGRGWAHTSFQVRPDLAAPGVDVTTTAVGGGYASVSGTSFAAPFVTGAAALLMQWGIADGNDPYLYGEKVRAYLRRGARQLPGFARYPNNQVGYGALCVRESLPF